ncbi:ATP-binding protein [Paracoccus pantotrophus]|uniref:histidine kinase n=1 Tax=Paracoccus pantotrophus TaxID=82367 RepID=A0A7H9BP56_PARPN|nr:ATP-binding protein [Paracoccus pantotrophus]QLH13097.1 ATP-binding protein [Paracoccus pantotrophus]
MLLFSRFTPNVLLSAAVALSVILAAVMLGLAIDQRWLGLKLEAQPRLAVPVSFEGLWIDAIEHDSPAAGQPGAGIPASVASLVSLGGPDGRRIQLTPQDLMEEPDALETYAGMRAFFARQDEIAAVLRSIGGVELGIAFLGETQTYSVSPKRQRPVASLPPSFWMQIGVGLAGFWIGAWIWSLRRGEWATRFLFLAGAGLMISAFPAAVYSTRELALPGGLFRVLSTFNHIGALTFGVGMIGLFLVYPRRLVSPRWLALPAIVLGAWQVVDIVQLADGPGLGFHLAVVLAMLAIVVLVAIQFRVTRGHPRDRAALTWLGLAVIVGAGAFVATVIAPHAQGIGAFVSQGEAFLFFLLVYVGVALGVARYRLFQLDEWAFRILFYVVGVLLLLVLDAILIVTIIDERAPAFALSLLIVALAWLPLRDMLARLVLRRAEPSRGNLFRQVMDVALTPPGRDQQARWRALLEDAFRPLSIAPGDAEAPVLIDDGLALAVPGPGNLPDYRLDYASGGRKLFSLRDADLAAELTAMLANALESREAYEKGVAEERERIARDIHDNIGVQLMGALHSRGLARKDMMIRETLTDLRDIINNASNPDLSFDEMLADLRSQISEHLFAAGVKMKWEVESAGPAILPLAAAHTVRSVVREAVQNALKHGQPKSIRVTVRLDEDAIALTVADDGSGFDPSSVQTGNGLANMQARVTSLGGRFNVASGVEGTRIEARFPVDIVRITQ